MTDLKQTGGCLCGAVRFEVTGEPVISAHCYCKDCQKASGTSHITAIMYPQTQIKIKGDLKEYSSPAESGETVTRSFCPTCGSRLFGQSTSMEGLKTVMAGSFDDNSWIKPQAIVYDKDRPEWDRNINRLPSFPAMPPRP